MSQNVNMKLRNFKARTGIIIALLISGLGFIAPASGCDRALKTDMLQAAHRTPEFVLRDQYRHPFETVKFFDVKPGSTVVEIWPGKGWYTEVLNPLYGRW